MPGTVIGSGDPAVNQTRISVLVELTLRWGRQAVSKYVYDVSHGAVTKKKTEEDKKGVL